MAPRPPATLFGERAKCIRLQAVLWNDPCNSPISDQLSRANTASAPEGTYPHQGHEPWSDPYDVPQTQEAPQLAQLAIPRRECPKYKAPSSCHRRHPDVRCPKGTTAKRSIDGQAACKERCMNKSSWSGPPQCEALAYADPAAHQATTWETPSAVTCCL